MHNQYIMSASLESRKHRSQATMATAGFAAFMILLMFLLKWKLPVIEKIVEEPGILVEMTLPPEEPQVVSGGGGGGGNPVEAAGPAGVAPATPPAPGDPDDSKDIETDDNAKDEPVVSKPPAPKPEAKKVVPNTAVVKAPPKPVENPAPPRPKAVLGRTTGGTGTGGGVATTYDRTGGTGTGTGVGTGPGTGGGTGGGHGGGNGTGTGTGNGPRKISGSRVVINPKSMDAGENLKGKVYAEIRVSQDGVGTFVRTVRGSRYTSGEAIDIIREWLRRNRFTKGSGDELVVYEFNFLLGG